MLDRKMLEWPVWLIRYGLFPIEVSATMKGHPKGLAVV